MRGSWHIPVLAFVLGGVLYIQEGFTFLVFVFIMLYWLINYRRHLLFLFILFLFGIGGYIHLSPSTSSFYPQLLDHESRKGTIVSDVTETAQSISMVVKGEEGKFSSSFFERE